MHKCADDCRSAGYTARPSSRTLLRKKDPGLQHWEQPAERSETKPLNDQGCDHQTAEPKSSTSTNLLQEERGA